MNLFSELQGVEHMLDFHMQRHGVLAANLANADTPGYQAQELSFNALMNNAQMPRATQRGHIGSGSSAHGSSTGELDPSPSVDGNGVQVEHTLAQVTANRLRYEQGLELARRRLALIRYAATDGSG